MVDTTEVKTDDQHPVTVFKGMIGKAQADVCNARELHSFLQNRDMFANWIKARIQKYGFEQGQDYDLILVPTKTNGRGGDRRSKDYYLSLDMAKELSMVENNHRGREARRYFIAMERQALAAPMSGQGMPSVPEQSFQRVFQGRAIFFAFESSRLWASAANICSALGIGSADKLTRNVPAHQLHRVLRGTVKLRMIDMAVALRAADFCESEQRDAYRQWLKEIEAGFAGGGTSVNQVGLERPSHSLRPPTEAESTAMKLLATTRFLCSFDFDGKIRFSEIPTNAVVIAQDRLADFIGDPAGAPSGTLGDILEAVGRRMKALH